jgi:cellulose synthase (UDP-forming)
MRSYFETAAVRRSSRRHRYHDDIMQRRSRRNRFAYAVTLIAAAAYYLWALRWADYRLWYVAVPYLLAETLCLGNMVLWGLMMIQRREHPPRGLEVRQPLSPVDVIVSTCGEPFETVEKTLRAAARIDYPSFHVTVADDRCDLEIGALCRELGFTHLCRITHENRKAGNLNHAYARTGRPFVMTLDADQIPHPEILRRLMGYFAVPRIAFVQSYQAYNVPEGDPWGNRDRVFYGAMQPGRNASNSAISCGSGCVYRRASLDEVGGFATWSMLEDLYTSLLLQAAGWRSVYHPYPLSHGMMPQDVASHTRQRWQWAVDSLRLLFWRCPLFTTGLSWRQRLNYFHFGYHYVIFGIAYPIFYFLPAWALFSGEFVFKAPAWEFVLWRAPFLISALILNRLLTGRRQTVKSTQAQAGLFAVFFAAFVTALLFRRHVPDYSVTPKETVRISLIERLRHVLPHVIVMAFCAGGIVYGFFHRRDRLSFYLINSVWAAWAICLLFPFTILALRSTNRGTQP